jgi:hypothetical protein
MHPVCQAETLCGTRLSAAKSQQNPHLFTAQWPQSRRSILTAKMPPSCRLDIFMDETYKYCPVEFTTPYAIVQFPSSR